MPTKLGKAEKAAFEIANLLDDAADAIRTRSKRAYGAGRMSLEEYVKARARELELRAALSVIVATDLSGVLKEASKAGENIEQAMMDAEARIETVRSVKKGMEILALLVSLAEALASGNVKGVVKTAKVMSELT